MRVLPCASVVVCLATWLVLSDVDALGDIEGTDQMRETLEFLAEDVVTQREGIDRAPRDGGEIEPDETIRAQLRERLPLAHAMDGSTRERTQGNWSSGTPAASAAASIEHHDLEQQTADNAVLVGVRHALQPHLARDLADQLGLAIVAVPGTARLDAHARQIVDPCSIRSGSTLIEESFIWET